MTRKYNGLVLKFKKDKVDIVISPDTSANKVLIDAFEYIKVNLKKSKQEIMDLVMNLYLETDTASECAKYRKSAMC